MYTPNDSHCTQIKALYHRDWSISDLSQLTGFDEDTIWRVLTDQPLHPPEPTQDACPCCGEPLEASENLLRFTGGVCPDCMEQLAANRWSGFS